MKIRVSIMLLLLFSMTLTTVHAEYFNIIGSLDINYAPTPSIYVANGGNNYSYFYDGYYNIYAINVTKPAFPSQVGSITLPGSPGVERRAVISGNYLYVPRSGFATPDMDIVNISNPANLILTNTISQGTVRNLVVEGNYLYSTGDGPISVYDITTGNNPTLKWKSNNTNIILFDIAVRSGYVYGVGEGPLTVIDTVNKVIANTIIIGDYANRAVISDNLLYIGDRNSHIKIFDIASPGNPSLVGTYTINSTSSFPLGMAITGDRLFYAGNMGELYAFDISNPDNLIQIGVLTNLNAQDIYTNGDFIYAAVPGGLKILSTVPLPSTLLLLGSGLLGLAGWRRLKKS